MTEQPQSHKGPRGGAPPRDRPTRVEDLRLLRGRVLLREIHEDSVGLIVKPATWRDNKRGANRLSIHRGEVVDMGAPARTRKGAMVYPEFAVGDIVIFVFALATETYRTFEIDGKEYVMVAQEEVVAVVEP